jgi:hypothetical protein
MYEDCKNNITSFGVLCDNIGSSAITHTHKHTHTHTQTHTHIHVNQA